MATAAHLLVGPTRFEVPSHPSVPSARDLRSRIRRALQQGDHHVVVDCTGWSTLDLSLLSALIQCAAACREYGAFFELANMSSEIKAGVADLNLGARLGLA